MSFLAPWMLLGGLAVAVPIALHFFYKARYRPRPWAADAPNVREQPAIVTRGSERLRRAHGLTSRSGRNDSI